MSDSFNAFVLNKDGGGFSVGVQQLTLDDLPAGDVTVRVQYSSVNYKDGLACLPESPVVATYPMVPGIDLAGTVVESADPRFTAGQEVLAIGRALGISQFGGYAEYARLSSDWVEPLPSGLTLKEAMALGTAGFTAGLAIQRLEDNGLKPGDGPVLVTGATGGVGSTAVNMLAGLGYEVAASTGKAAEHEYLQKLGASKILSREDVSGQSDSPLEAELWAGAVDPVGADTTAYLLRTTRYGGSVATCGLTGGFAIGTTVLPFILRGVNLLGIDSVQCPPDVRAGVWRRLGTDLKPKSLAESISHEVGLEEIPAVTGSILAGSVKGRTIVRL
ncbi:acryloyl-CoA reductase [Mycobacterium talmoniae]|uniref:Oxidoreductase n=1 Tax=Mycobacterium talmoniae TaxID=1858794 RepID=A0A1S1NSV7_9MYCO|nr:MULTISPECIES: acryloyl-CoA reductase [Mycobacterium]OHV06215.1 oxidoreductase [Mycobacterium talmoniae]PQM48707.1 Putative quinone oxidoreductase YhfP [Mycobacterium talmoniae]TDH57084.1 acryloyl-CoA reductase [Mycobacterium eburneum]